MSLLRLNMSTKTRTLSVWLAPTAKKNLLLNLSSRSLNSARRVLFQRLVSCWLELVATMVQPLLLPFWPIAIRSNGITRKVFKHLTTMVPLYALRLSALVVIPRLEKMSGFHLAMFCPWFTPTTSLSVAGTLTAPHWTRPWLAPR